MQKLDFQVQSQDLDGQGIVNNVSYYSYLDKARIKFIESILDINYVQWAKEGKFLILSTAQISFKKSLVKNDHFSVVTYPLIESEIKIGINQSIYRKDDELILKAKLTATCFEEIDGKRHFFVPEAFKKYENEMLV